MTSLAGRDGSRSRAAESATGSLSGQRHGHLAGRPRGRQRQDQRRFADRADRTRRGLRRRQGARASVFAERHIGEQRLGNLPHLAGGEVAAPRLDANRHRAKPGLDQFAVAADFIADKDRLLEHHAVDGYRGAAPTAPPEFRRRGPSVLTASHRKRRRWGWRPPAWPSPGSTARPRAIPVAVLAAPCNDCVHIPSDPTPPKLRRSYDLLSLPPCGEDDNRNGLSI